MQLISVNESRRIIRSYIRNINKTQDEKILGFIFDGLFTPNRIPLVHGDESVVDLSMVVYEVTQTSGWLWWKKSAKHRLFAVIKNKGIEAFDANNSSMVTLVSIDDGIPLPENVTSYCPLNEKDYEQIKTNFKLCYSVLEQRVQNRMNARFEG